MVILIVGTRYGLTFKVFLVKGSPILVRQMMQQKILLFASGQCPNSLCLMKICILSVYYRDNVSNPIEFFE